VINFKKDFPIFGHFEKGGRPLVYLDSAACAQMPRVVLDAVRDFSTMRRANVHRALYALSDDATRAYGHARETVKNFINARSCSEIIFTRNTTEGINLVAYSLAKSLLKPGDHILTSIAEHHSNFVPWQMLRDEHGIILDIVDVNEEGVLSLAEIESQIHPKTKLAAFSHVSHVLGTINPVEEMATLFKDRGVLFLIDAAQSVAHLPLDAQKMDCDFLAFSGYKLGAPTGIGVLNMAPFQRGGGMIHEATLEKTSWHKELPLRFEAGTPNAEGAVGLAAAIQYIEKIGFSAIHKNEKILLEKTIDELNKIPGIKIWGPHKSVWRGGLVSFSIDGARPVSNKTRLSASAVSNGIHPHDLATILDRDNICIRAGHHCAMPLHQKLGVTATSRASFWVYNTPNDIIIFVNGIKRAIEPGARAIPREVYKN
jgi:cysteine desulfurase / selenocysteine lyase